MPHRCPRKQTTAQNTAGLWNQGHSGAKSPASCSSSESESEHFVPLKHPKLSGLCDSMTRLELQDAMDSDEDWKLTSVFDSTKFIAGHKESEEESETEDSDLPFISDDNA